LEAHLSTSGPDPGPLRPLLLHLPGSAWDAARCGLAVLDGPGGRHAVRPPHPPRAQGSPACVALCNIAFPLVPAPDGDGGSSPRVTAPPPPSGSESGRTTSGPSSYFVVEEYLAGPGLAVHVFKFGVGVGDGDGGGDGPAGDPLNDSLVVHSFLTPVHGGRVVGSWSLPGGPTTGALLSSTGVVSTAIARALVLRPSPWTPGQDVTAGDVAAWVRSALVGMGPLLNTVRAPVPRGCLGVALGRCPHDAPRGQGVLTLCVPCCTGPGPAARRPPSGCCDWWPRRPTPTRRSRP